VNIDNPVDHYTSANLQNQSIHAALRSAAQQVLSSFRAEVITNQQCFVNNYVPNQTLLQLSHAVKGLKFELDLITGICRHYLEFIKNERRATTLRNRGFINFLFKQSIASELCTSPKIRPRFVKKEKLSFRDFDLFQGIFITSSEYSNLSCDAIRDDCYLDTIQLKIVTKLPNRSTTFVHNTF